ncbi:MAG TPA: alpha/beta fold hydrolase [Candidatus Competibacteraceae bacterium]|nr:alpha/beta fold hydrolase [Candidatus Competibacteraceae bacterium]HRZ06785.1 alpha/beta fold hydrolase [Candidatus Competibacteraceae bacterium]HSA46460.1 alpha/beta fold hydrolase [Candidatus Competibacteraceae bacterium]
MLGSHIPETIDRMVNANLARGTAGISPAVLAMAYLDWLMHLGLAPGKQALLNEKAIRKMVRLALYAFKSSQNPNISPCIEPLPQDHRFDGEGWKQWPYNLIYQSFLLTQQWWYNATTRTRGVDKRNDAIVSFVTRQILDMYSPSNSPLTNPEILKATMEEGGQNLVRGWTNFMADMEKMIAGKRLDEDGEQFVVGRDVAVTPGQVIFRNSLIELIQYQPTAQKVYAEPILIVPAWIMKYYILDLSPHNSMVRYLVEKGHTVFMISWINPTAADRDLGMDDYREDGVMAALDAIATILPGRKVHSVGYCLGGTLLTLTAAAMARDGDHRLKTVTLFAAQTDFSEAGELLLFINESQVAFLEDMMWDQGYLDAGQMVGAFQLLRSNDLIWSRMVHDYLLGQRQSLNDLMAWNADQTRMPFRMHSEYLRHIFLGNELATGHYKVKGRSVAITDIHAPIFTVATEQDHVAPWRSVYKINLLADADQVTFLLTSGGHNAGIVSEPGHGRRSYQMACRTDQDRYIDPDTWQATIPKQPGSWWPAWQTWLVKHSAEHQVSPPPMGVPEKGLYPLCAAPGTYVLQK